MGGGLWHYIKRVMDHEDDMLRMGSFGLREGGFVIGRPFSYLDISSTPEPLVYLYKNKISPCCTSLNKHPSPPQSLSHSSAPHSTCPCTNLPASFVDCWPMAAVICIAFGNHQKALCNTGTLIPIGLDCKFHKWAWTDQPRQRMVTRQNLALKP